MRAIDADVLFREMEKAQWYNNADRDEIAEELVLNAPTIEPERKTGIPRDAIEYILWKETVSTNPYNFTANEKFIKFMDDPEIASFGRWQHANGFNTALVAVKCDLDKIPDSEPERKKGTWIEQDDGWDDVYYECSACGEPWTTIDGTPWDNGMKFCPNCGAEMRGDAECQST